MRWALFMLSAFLVTQTTHAAEKSKWDELLDRNGGRFVRFGALLSDATSYERNADELLPPASVAKLITAGAALEHLGPDYRFATRIEWRAPFANEPGKATELTVIGSGDPTWGMAEWDESLMSRFEKIARLLKKSGVRQVVGPIRILSGDPRWDQVTVPSGWRPQYLVSCDGALPRAINIQRNCANLILKDPTRSEWLEPGVPTPVTLAIQWGDVTKLRAERVGDGIRITGTWLKGTRPFAQAFPVTEPMVWAENLLKAALDEQEISTDSRAPATAGDLSPNSLHSATLSSPPLREILKWMLKKSINLFGETLWVALGGWETVHPFLESRIPGDTAIRLWDGSGLSRSNTASARSVVAYLAALRSSPYFPVIWDSLAIAGVDGTIASRMKGTAAEGVLRAKTGTLRGYYHLAGYVPRFNAVGQAIEYLPFAILARAAPERRASARAAQDRVGAELARETNQ